MKTEAGFSTKVLAEQAAQVLIRAGVPQTAIRLWNIIPKGEPSGPSPDYGKAKTGAVAGAVLGGLEGLALGAVIGGALDASAASDRRMPLPSGVRLVVENPPSGVDVTGILRECGAWRTT